MAHPRQSLVAFGAVFSNPPMRRLQLAWSISMIGTWAYGIAVFVYAYHQDGAAAVGIVGMARWLAAAACAPWASMLGDRYSRVRVMVGANLGRVAALVVASVAAYAGGPSIVVYLMSGVISVIATAFRPAQAALVPSIARSPEELSAANVTSSTIESAGIFIGPAVGGLLLAFSSAGTVFALDAVALLASAFLVAGIPDSRVVPATGRRGGALGEALAGFRAIAGAAACASWSASSRRRPSSTGC